MTGLLDRIEARDDGAVVKAGGRPVAEIERRLSGGEAPAEVADALGLGPADLLAALAFLALGPDEGEGPPLVQGRPPFPALEASVHDAVLAKLLPATTRPARLALAAGLLQVHDFWDASHHAAQEADDLGEARFSAYWHGIAHRREPDAGNAAYWFRRVGRHSLFGPLGAAAVEMLEGDGSGLATRVAPGGRWNALGFVEVCRLPRDERVVRRLQRLEMVMLLDETVAAIL